MGQFPARQGSKQLDYSSGFSDSKQDQQPLDPAGPGKSSLFSLVNAKDDYNISVTREGSKILIKCNEQIQEYDLNQFNELNIFNVNNERAENDRIVIGKQFQNQIDQASKYASAQDKAELKPGAKGQLFHSGFNVYFDWVDNDFHVTSYDANDFINVKLNPFTDEYVIHVTNSQGLSVSKNVPGTANVYVHGIADQRQMDLGKGVVVKYLDDKGGVDTVSNFAEEVLQEEVMESAIRNGYEYYEPRVQEELDRVLIYSNNPNDKITVIRNKRNFHEIIMTFEEEGREDFERRFSDHKEINLYVPKEHKNIFRGMDIRLNVHYGEVKEFKPKPKVVDPFHLMCQGQIKYPEPILKNPYHTNFSKMFVSNFMDMNTLAQLESNQKPEPKHPFSLK